ncbi:MAG: cache domain-containing protein [Sulfurovaceae bacterium]
MTLFLQMHLTSLELIAASPEAKSADWKKIKSHLEKIAPNLPGVYFFVLPDGNYYTITQNYTNLNLSDRAYFKSLFAGNQVKGYPIYSRSSGKKSVVVAVPIMVDKKVIGALGTSVFLDELYIQLDRDFAISKNYTWFVLDNKGDTMLDQNNDMIFTNIFMRVSKTMQETLSQTLTTKKSGTIQYEQKGLKYAHYRKLHNMPWRIILMDADSSQIQAAPLLNISLKRFVPDLQNKLDQIDRSMSKLINKSNINIKNESEVRKLLISILDANPDVIEASFIDKQGFLRHIEPSDYKNFENIDISDQKHVIALRKKSMPIFSSSFKAVEGFLSVDIAYPLYDNQKNLNGSISALIRPDLLIKSILKKSTIPDDYELWIMQPDGTLIYDQDSDEIGRNLFSDPMYAEYESLLALGKKVASTPSGSGSYIFLAPGSKEKVIKNVIWQSVKLHGREWRVALAYRPYKKNKQ